MSVLVANFQNYLALTKPKVILLMLVTALIGMLLAEPLSFDNFSKIILATFGISLAAMSAAVINQLVESKIDAKMRRTQWRPIVKGNITNSKALIFALGLGILGIFSLIFYVNPLCAVLTLFSQLGYALFYTSYLKHATPQNIVIGGVFGASPPLLGQVAMTNSIEPIGLILLLIIFAWTPPHFWALAINRKQDYQNARLPMLPVTHGIEFTKLQIVLYTALLTIITILPYLIHYSGITYLLVAIGLNIQFFYFVGKLYKDRENKIALPTFFYSIIYLYGLFLGLLLDYYLRYYLS